VVERAFNELLDEYNHWVGSGERSDDCVQNMKVTVEIYFGF
jgi:hypothetical protein